MEGRRQYRGGKGAVQRREGGSREEGRGQYRGGIGGSTEEGRSAEEGRGREEVRGQYRGGVVDELVCQQWLSSAHHS